MCPQSMQCRSLVAIVEKFVDARGKVGGTPPALVIADIGDKRMYGRGQVRARRWTLRCGGLLASSPFRGPGRFASLAHLNFRQSIRRDTYTTRRMTTPTAAVVP